MKTGSEIRQSFLDFFKSKQHTIVSSSSLMPDSPNLLFTNAGMNQFVPIFLGQQTCPYKPGRAADTQKCIRAGGKHNDLEDVGLDTYHHTFFEMLGNWSFGDYFKKEAIEWAWELLTEHWHFPRHRLYATYFGGDDKTPADLESRELWLRFLPAEQIVPGNRKDNFWMMGDTGPCGPCSEIHVDLTPNGDTRGSLVNKGSPQCIEIWNLVFIQFNANADGTLAPLPAKHVDTGMGFERVTSIIQCTKNFKDFNAVVSNYETDVFRPIFNRLEELSGKKYGSTLPVQSPRFKVQIEIDIAFRVIADHIRTVSFAIADGIQPGNTDRNYVIRRILRRAVRYGRSLDFHEPFFYKLVDVLAETMGDAFPEIRKHQEHVKNTIRTEEEAFNRTLDRGIEFFNAEVVRLGSAPAPGVAERALAVGSQGAKYSKRRLPHFERPWGKYMVTFSTHQKRQLTPAERDIVLQSILYAHEKNQYQLFAACVMPDHVHLLFEPQIKEQDKDGTPVFYSLGEILHGVKSTTAHKINKAAKVTGVHVWEEESFDRLMRGDFDLEEKFHYICRNPWDNGIVSHEESYKWLWVFSQPDQEVSREGAGNSARGGRAPKISGEFAFKLYDTYGFPLDLTELMAREQGLTVDVAGFEKLMDEQRSRARAAQKKEVIEVSQIKTDQPTKFVGYDQLETTAKVLDVISVKGRTAVILDTTTCYPEMGGQVGDSGELILDGKTWRIADTQKTGQTYLHFLEGSTGATPVDLGDSPRSLKLVGEGADESTRGRERSPGEEFIYPGMQVIVKVDVERRKSIQRHHTVTHLLHWALHEIVGKEATQKGSYVGSEKLTFDFNSAALSPKQVEDVERLVNERILDNAPVTWMEVPYAQIKNNKDVMQFFGDKYGDVVRVVQIGDYSKELCGGTHVRGTGELGLFRVVHETSVSAGVRRIEAVCGLKAYAKTRDDHELLQALAQKLSTAPHDIVKRVETLVEQTKKLEKEKKDQSKSAALGQVDAIVASKKEAKGIAFIVADAGELDIDALRNLMDAVRAKIPSGLIVLGCRAGDKASFIASASDDAVAKGVHCGKLIGQVAKIAGGGGGGKPNKAEAGGKDISKVAEALAEVEKIL